METTRDAAGAVTSPGAAKDSTTDVPDHNLGTHPGQANRPTYAALPDPAGPWSACESCALDRAVAAYEILIGHSDGRQPGERNVLSILYALTRGREFCR